MSEAAAAPLPEAAAAPVIESLVESSPPATTKSPDGWTRAVTALPADHDAAMWFTAMGTGVIGRIDIDGAITDELPWAAGRR